MLLHVHKVETTETFSFIGEIRAITILHSTEDSIALLLTFPNRCCDTTYLITMPESGNIFWPSMQGDYSYIAVSADDVVAIQKRSVVENPQPRADDGDG